MITSLLVVPLLGVFGILLSKDNSTSKVIALSTSLFNFTLSLVLLGLFDSNQPGFQFTQSLAIHPGAPSYGVLVGVDGISLLFVLLTTLIIPTCILASWNTIKEHELLKYFLIAYLVLESLLIAVFVVLDLILFYVCFESVLIPMFLIIGIWGHGIRRILATLMLFLYTLFGSLFMLLSILTIAMLTGSTDYQLLTTVELESTAQYVLWLGIFLALAIKTPLVPFHLWLPKAHAEAPLDGSIILAGVIIKMAIYGYIRMLISLLPDATAYFTPLVYTLCVISIVYTTFTTLRQIDLKKIIAYSSIGHMGICVVGLFSNTIQGMEGSILLVIAHGLVSPGLFICVGVLYERYHSRLLKYFRGLAISHPVFCTAFFIFTLANMAVPLTGNFVGEFLSFAGAFQRNPLLTSLGASGMVLTAAYSIWLYNRVCFGVQSQFLIRTPDLSRREYYLILPLLFLTFLLGIAPNVALELLHLPVSNLLYIIL